MRRRNSARLFEDQVDHRRRADVDHFMPLRSATGIARSGFEHLIAGTLAIGDPHRSALKRIADVSRMKMPLMSLAREESAAQKTVPGIFAQQLACRFAFPAREQSIR